MLTDQQKRFIEYFSQTGNATQSAIKAISPSVKLGAINSLLDRTGYQTTHKVEDVTGKKTDEELRQELNHLLSTIHVIKSDGGGGSIN
jgi:hypothetical protein